MHASQEGSSLSSKREHPHHPRPQAHLLGSPTCCSQPPHPSQHPSICLNHGPSTQNTPRRRAVAHPGAQSLRGSSLHPPCMHTRDNSSPPTTPCSHSIFSGHSRRGKPQQQCLGRAHWGVGREHVCWTRRKPGAQTRQESIRFHSC